MELLPYKLFRSTSNNKLYLVSPEDKTFLLKCYYGPRAQERKNSEFQTLQFWRDNEYPVPKCYDLEITDIVGPYLVMDYLPGTCLGEYLADPEVPVEKKLEKIGEIFRNNFVRHSKALKKKEPRLVHNDANTGNIVVSSDGCYYIDFEGSVKKGPLDDMVCREMAKLCRWVARDMGRDSLEAVVGNMVKAYQEKEELLRRIVELTIGRPFQIIHRLRDLRKKKANPGDVTKYDIADTLKKALGAN